MAASPLRLTTDRDEPCPVPDEILGRLYRAHAHTLSDILATLPPQQRVNLAVFCYGRAHLRDIGIAIAATCEHEPLVRIAGRIGDVLFDLSRNKPMLTRAVPGRRSITLAKGASTTAPAAFDQEPAELDAATSDEDDSHRDQAS